VKNTKNLWITILLFLFSCRSQQQIDVDVFDNFESRQVEGGFLLYDLRADQYLEFCGDRCSKRFIPASTFKLLNAQIALGTGVVADENEIILWDGVVRGIPAWNQNHTLKTAMENSVVWFYQELARRIGQDRMQHYLDVVGYGNQDISGSAGAFWLEGNLRISQYEQIEFLRKLYAEQLPFSERTMRTVKEIIILEETENYRLSGKTGWSSSVDPDVGWFVGYLEKDDNVYFFATNVNQEGSVESLGKLSREITAEILQALGITE